MKCWCSCLLVPQCSTDHLYVRWYCVLFIVQSQYVGETHQRHTYTVEHNIWMWKGITRLLLCCTQALTHMDKSDSDHMDKAVFQTVVLCGRHVWEAWDLYCNCIIEEKVEMKEKQSERCVSTVAWHGFCYTDKWYATCVCVRACVCVREKEGERENRISPGVGQLFLCKKNRALRSFHLLF